MSSRPFLGLLYILRGLKDLGEDIDPVLARHGLDLATVEPNSPIDRALELKIYVEVAGRLRDPLAGLKAGTYIGFTGYGPLTMLLLTATNAYEAMQLGIRFQQLTFLYGHLSFLPGAERSALVLEPIALPGSAYRFRVDGEVSGTWKLIRDMQGALGLQDLRPEQVDLPYPRPAEAEARAIEAFYGCPVYFGEPVSRLWTHNNYLHLRFPTADATANGFYRSQCEQLLLKQAAAPERLADRVAAHLALFSEGFPDAAAVAAAFGLAERSFRRQLSQEGSSFRVVLEGVRYDKARLLLGQGLPVDEIARRLGYAESSSFIHAFQRWAGASPAAFRRAQAAARPPG
jgi:AraC-like DNA-binding protein